MALCASGKIRFVRFMAYFNEKYPFYTLTQKGKNEVINSIVYERTQGHKETAERLISKREWSVKKEYHTTNTPEGIALHFEDGQIVRINREIDEKRSKGNQTIGQSVGRFFFTLRRDAIKFVLENRKKL